MVFALAGNQNSGKTTLFNQLTGSNQHVGNFPGVTVDRKEGVIRSSRADSVVDLPGIYSLAPYTSEEIVTRDFLLAGRPDGIINIVDATNIQRNLYLSMQLIELGLPMVIALNMMDEVRSNGGTIKIEELERELGVPVVPISASKNEGIDELIAVAVRTASARRNPQRQDFCSGAVHRAIHAVAHVVEDHADRIGVPRRFAATRLVEGDEPMQQSLRLSPNESDMLEHAITEMETELGTDRRAAMADMRYAFIETMCAECVVIQGESREHLRSQRIDHILTHKYLAIPVFLGIMLLIFWLTFGVIGSTLSDLLSVGIDNVTQLVSGGLLAYGINPVMHSLMIDGVFAGVGSVLSFIPTIVVLFFFLSLLEDSGYMARVAFVMDKLLRQIGLSGRSFVPMLIGFGCSVPAIMATRTLSSERDRNMTILLTPFMSCSAKLPIYSIFTMAFFPRYRALVMICLYLGGMAVGIVSALILKRTAFRGKPVPFVMELPNYRLPSFKSVCLLLWDKAKDFLSRAFTIIFLATIVIWFFQTFDTRFNVVASSTDSMLAGIGRFLAPVFAPLGFSDWRASTALITGFTAKEAVVSTLAVLTETSISELPAALAGIFTPLSAVSFLTFTLLYTPCVAAIGAVKREMHSGWRALLVALYQSAVAWVVSFAVYRIGSLVAGAAPTGMGALDYGLLFLIAALAVLALRYSLRHRGRCGGCTGCSAGRTACTTCPTPELHRREHGTRTERLREHGQHRAKPEQPLRGAPLAHAQHAASGADGSPKHVDSSPKHADCSPKHADCSPKHADCSPKHADCSLKHADCSPEHADCSPEHADCSPEHADCSPKHARNGAPHREGDAKP